MRVCKQGRERERASERGGNITIIQFGSSELETLELEKKLLETRTNYRS